MAWHGDGSGRPVDERSGVSVPIGGSVMDSPEARKFEPSPQSGPGLRVAHVDVDAFFASAAVSQDPTIAGRPVVVAGSGPRAVVATASYEARRFGVRSAMPLGQARSLCADLVVVPPDFALYRVLSLEVAAAVAEHVERFERVSLDEAYLDLSAPVRQGKADAAPASDPGSGDVESVGALLTSVRHRIAARTGLSVSCGAGVSRAVAKLASEAAKPGGVVVVEPGRTAAFLGSLPVSALPGVGPVSAERLHRVGVRSVDDVLAFGLAGLVKVLGVSSANMLFEVASGRGPFEVTPNVPPRSVGSESTFDEDITDPVVFQVRVARLAEQALARMAFVAAGASTVTVKARSAAFVDVSRSLSLNDPSADVAMFSAVVEQLAVVAFEAVGGAARLAGVTFSGLADVSQPSLFDLDASAGDEGCVGHQSVVRWRVGDTACHATFGEGVVVALDEGAAVVRFGLVRDSGDPVGVPVTGGVHAPVKVIDLSRLRRPSG